MNGFSISREVSDKALEDISHAVLDPLLPLYEFQEVGKEGGREGGRVNEGACRYF